MEMTNQKLIDTIKANQIVSIALHGELQSRITTLGDIKHLLMEDMDSEAAIAYRRLNKSTLTEAWDAVKILKLELV